MYRSVRDSTLGKYLFFQGAIVLMAGVLAGIAYWLAIIKNKGKEVINVWRVAHSFLSIYGMLMLIVGILIPQLILGKFFTLILLWSFVISSYAFVVAFIVGAFKRCRGLTPLPFGLNTFLFVCHTIGISGSLIGIVIIVYGSLKAII